MKIFLVGGGSGGPIAPLVAVAESIRKLKPKSQIFFIGRGDLSERGYFGDAAKSITFLQIPSGKWRRYFSLLNILDLFKIFFGFWKSLYLLKKYDPDLVFGAGSFVQVPMSYAAYFMRIPVVVHQQDLQILLSTSLVTSIATAVTVTFESTMKEFHQSSGLFGKFNKSKFSVTGNPVREGILGGKLETAQKFFSLDEKFPTILVMGGGGGASGLNKIIYESLPELTKYVQVIHATGGKQEQTEKFSNYHAYNFLDTNQLREAYAAADLVVSRGGLSTLTELSCLGKAAILVPLPKSPQEVNVELFNLMQAAIGIPEKFLNSTVLTKLIRKLLWEKEITDKLRNNIQKIMPRNASATIANLLIKTATKSHG